MTYTFSFRNIFLHRFIKEPDTVHVHDRLTCISSNGKNLPPKGQVKKGVAFDIRSFRMCRPILQWTAWSAWKFLSCLTSAGRWAAWRYRTGVWPARWRGHMAPTFFTGVANGIKLLEHVFWSTWNLAILIRNSSFVELFHNCCPGS